MTIVHTTPARLIWCAEVGVKAATCRILKIAYTRQSKANFHGLQGEKQKEIQIFMTFSLHHVAKRAMYLAHDIMIRGHVSTNTTYIHLISFHYKNIIGTEVLTFSIPSPD